MVKYANSLVANLDMNDAFDLVLQFFTANGYSVDSTMKPTQLNLSRGSILWSNGSFRSKKCTLRVSFSQMKEGLLILCEYDMHWLVHDGKKDPENLEREFHALEASLTTVGILILQAEARDRICVACKRHIPFDAIFCSYCGHDYRQIEKS